MKALSVPGRWRWFGENGYAFFTQNPQSRWEPLEQDGLLGAYQYRGQYEQVVYLQGQSVSLPKQEDIRPQVFILPTGKCCRSVAFARQ